MIIVRFFIFQSLYYFLFIFSTHFPAAHLPPLSQPVAQLCNRAPLFQYSCNCTVLSQPAMQPCSRLTSSTRYPCRAAFLSCQQFICAAATFTPNLLRSYAAVPFLPASNTAVQSSHYPPNINLAVQQHYLIQQLARTLISQLAVLYHSLTVLNAAEVYGIC